MKGIIQTHAIPAPSLEGNPLGDTTSRLTPIYLPEALATSGHQSSSKSSQRFPVVYFLHGFTGNGLSWLNTIPFSMTVPERIDRLIERKQMPPFIGVFVDGWTAFGGSQWINSEATGRYRDYLVRDVIGFVDRTFPTIADRSARAVIGKSSGGYGALVMGRYHPDIFAHIGSQSGDSYFEYSYLPELPKAATAFAKAGGLEPWFKEFSERARETKMKGDDHAVIDMLAMSAAYSARRGEPLNVDFPLDLKNGRLKPEIWGKWLENDPVRFVPASLDAFARLETIYIDCGTRDEFNLRWGSRMIAESLQNARISVLHEEFDDGHRGTNYRFDRSLTFIAPRLQGAKVG